MDQLTSGIGTRLQHTQHEPGVIVGTRYATYLNSFIYHGIKEIKKMLCTNFIPMFKAKHHYK